MNAQSFLPHRSDFDRLPDELLKAIYLKLGFAKSTFRATCRRCHVAANSCVQTAEVWKFNTFSIQAWVSRCAASAGKAAKCGASLITSATLETFEFVETAGVSAG